MQTVFRQCANTQLLLLLLLLSLKKQGRVRLLWCSRCPSCDALPNPLPWPCAQWPTHLWADLSNSVMSLLWPRWDHSSGRLNTTVESQVRRCLLNFESQPWITRRAGLQRCLQYLWFIIGHCWAGDASWAFRIWCGRGRPTNHQLPGPWPLLPLCVCIPCRWIAASSVGFNTLYFPIN